MKLLSFISSLLFITLFNYNLSAQASKEDLLNAFNDLDGASPQTFTLIQEDTFLTLPVGHDNMFYHQQGIQKLANGGFAISGSARDMGYIYLTNSDLKVTSVITPEFRNQANEKYNHLGGFQVSENILAIGLERLESRANGTSLILFYNVADIEHPVFLEHLSIIRNDVGTQTAGAVGLVNLGDHWIVMVANWDAARVDMYRSNHGDLSLEHTHFSKKPDLSWKPELGFREGSIDEEWGNYQNINLFSSSNKDELWMIAIYSKRAGLAQENWADLYQLSLSETEISLHKKSKKRFESTGPIFKDGGGFFYNTKTAAFEVYACSRNMDADGRSVGNRWN